MGNILKKRKQGKLPKKEDVVKPEENQKSESKNQEKEILAEKKVESNEKSISNRDMNKEGDKSVEVPDAQSKQEIEQKSEPNEDPPKEETKTQDEVKPTPSAAEDKEGNEKIPKKLDDPVQTDTDSKTGNDPDKLTDVHITEPQLNQPIPAECEEKIEESKPVPENASKCDESSEVVVCPIENEETSKTENQNENKDENVSETASSSEIVKIIEIGKGSTHIIHLSNGKSTTIGEIRSEIEKATDCVLHQQFLLSYNSVDAEILKENGCDHDKFKSRDMQLRDNAVVLENLGENDAILCHIDISADVARKFQLSEN